MSIDVLAEMMDRPDLREFFAVSQNLSYLGLIPWISVIFLILSFCLEMAI